jgi:hypothetical protein
MAFPLSPANNQIALVNGIEYYYNTTKGAWYRYGDATANVITSNTFQVLSSVVFSDNTNQTTAFTGTAIDSTARIIANAGFLAANTADQRAVTSGVYANAAFAAANSAAGSSTDTFARAQSNAAFAAANTADQRAVTSGVYANAAFGVANSASSYANGAFAAANTADQKAVIAGSYANSAFGVANTKYNSTGGTISGDVVVTGNLTISGQTTYANSTVVNLGDSIITLNADIPQGLAPTENAGIEIDRGSSDNVSLLWNETSDKWTFTNDGTNYSQVGSAAAESYANSSYIHANAAFAAANSANITAQTAFNAANNSSDTFARAQANASFGVANSASSYANGAFVAANTADQRAVTSGDYANSAYLQANAAFTYANTISGGSAIDNVARALANSANVLAQAAYNQANSALSNTNLNVSGTIRALNQGGDEGGEIFLDRPVTNTSLAAGITIDIFQNKLRIFETGGSVRGVFIDIANSASAGVGTDLLNPTATPDTVARATANAAFNQANSANVLAQSAFNSSNTKLSLSGGTISGNVTANSFIANTSVYSPVFYSPAAGSRLELSDIGLVGITVAGQTYQFGASGIESSPGVYGGTYGGNRLSLNSETNLISNRLDTVKIQTGTTGTVVNEWTFSNNTLIFPDSTVQNTAFTGTATDTTARTTANSASSYANGAFAAANTADQKGVSAGVYANAAFAVANSAGGTLANLAYAHANASYVHANAAFNQANTGGAGTDTFARTQANAAFDAANSAGGTVATLAYAHANAAFDVANSGGSQIYVASLQNFTSNGQNTTFTLSTTPTSANQLFVYVDGIYQQASAYTLNNDVITLSEALDANAVLEVRVLANSTPAHINNRIDTFTGTGACTTFTLSSVPRDKNLTTIIVGGVPQLKSAYNISGSSLVFSGAPANGASVEVSTYSGGGSYATSFTSVIDTFAGDNSTTTFTLSTLPQSENQTFAFLNGVYQQKNTYSLSGANIVFTDTATTNDTIEIVTVAGSEMNVTSARYNTRAYTANGVQTTFTISSGHTANSILVFENGICQEPIADYTVSGTTLTFLGGAPVVNTRIQIRELPV